MEGIQQWAFSVCAAAVVCGMARMLLPQGNMQRVLQMTVSVFFLCCLLSPVVLHRSSLRIAVQENTQAEVDQRAAYLADTLDQQTEQYAASELEQLVQQKLGAYGIKPSSVTIHMSSDGQSAPEAQVALSTEDEQTEDRIRRVVAEELGLELRLRYEQKGG